MTDYIIISNLNDFIFCPYSIYLHNVYMDADKEVYYASPQIVGTNSHSQSDHKLTQTRSDLLESLSVYSKELGLIGKIDVYNRNTHVLTERKYRLTKIYRGQLYQIWAQYFCMSEMGYKVVKIQFYEISTNKVVPIDIPGENEHAELRAFIEEFRRYDPHKTFAPNPEKCRHCIYVNMCDKTEEENVY